MVGIQYPTADIRRGNKKRRRRYKKPQGKNIMSASAAQGGHNYFKEFLECFSVLFSIWNHGFSGAQSPLRTHKA